MTKLENIFKRLVSGGKMNKKQLIAKLMGGHANVEDISSIQEVTTVLLMFFRIDLWMRI